MAGRYHISETVDDLISFTTDLCMVEQKLLGLLKALFTI